VRKLNGTTVVARGARLYSITALTPSSIVREDWLEQLDLRSLEKVGGTYVRDDLRERADDVVSRVRWGNSPAEN
jgi:hypothetical protein